MFCDRILGNLDTDEVNPPEIDWLDLNWRECSRRALRKQTRGGIEIKLLLPIGQIPRHRDILSRDFGSLVAVNLIPTQVLVARPQDLSQMGQLALELGNQHVPVEIDLNEVIMIPDGPAEAVLRRLEVPFSLERRRFSPASCSITNILESNDFTVSYKSPG